MPGLQGAAALTKRHSRGRMAHHHALRAGNDARAAGHAVGVATLFALAAAALPIRCGPGPGCGQRVDPLGDHALACPRTGLLARRAKTVERAWVRVAREAVGPDGQVVPQHCDATLVSPLRRTGQPQPGAAETDGSALRTAERRKHATYPELRRAGPQRLLVLGSEVGGRWNGEAARFVRDLVRVRAHRAPPAVRTAAAAGWSRRWWGMLAVAVQQAVASTAPGCAWPAPPHPNRLAEPPLESVLDLAPPAGPARLPLRGE